VGKIDAAGAERLDQTALSSLFFGAGITSKLPKAVAKRINLKSVFRTA